MWNKVEQYIKEHQLLDKQQRYIVGLSGGADSVALLVLLHKLGYQVEAAHCNFKLRGKESERDEEYCKKLCHQLALPIHIVHFDTAVYTELHKVSIEMAARKLRYRYFEQLRKDIHASGICIAHHRDDSIETILMNIVRGTGLKGLMGIRPRNGYILRPLLCCTRNEIEAYVQDVGIEYVTDSSNMVDDVKRNKVRLNVVPQLKTLNPSFDEAMMKMVNHVEEAEKIIHQSIHTALQTMVCVEGDMPLWLETLKQGRGSVNLPNFTLRIDKLTAYVSPEYLLYYVLSPYGFNATQTELIAQSLTGQTGKSWVSDHFEVVIDRTQLLVAKRETVQQKAMKIPETGKYIYSEALSIRITEEQVDEGFEIPKALHTIALDKQKVAFPLLLRPIKQGDRFTPFGMRGSKLVSDFLTDQKVDALTKRKQLVLVDAMDTILWVVGRRMSDKARIGSATKAVYRLVVE